MCRQPHVARAAAKGIEGGPARQEAVGVGGGGGGRGRRGEQGWVGFPSSRPAQGAHGLAERGRRHEGWWVGFRVVARPAVCGGWGRVGWAAASEDAAWRGRRLILAGPCPAGSCPVWPWPCLARRAFPAGPFRIFSSLAEGGMIVLQPLEPSWTLSRMRAQRLRAAGTDRPPGRGGGGGWEREARSVTAGFENASCRLVDELPPSGFRRSCRVRYSTVVE